MKHLTKRQATSVANAVLHRFVIDAKVSNELLCHGREFGVAITVISLRLRPWLCFLHHPMFLKIATIEAARGFVRHFIEQNRQWRTYDLGWSLPDGWELPVSAEFCDRPTIANLTVFFRSEATQASDLDCAYAGFVR